MYLEIVIAVCSIVVCIQAGPVPTSFYKAIELSVRDSTLTCPSLRISKVITEPEFLLKCTDSERARLLTHLKTEENIYDALCLLYYNNFLNLCVASSSFTNTSIALIPDSIIENSQYNLEQICEILNTSSSRTELKPGIEALQNTFGSTLGNRKCKRICSLFDDSIKPVCMLSAFMVDLTKKLYLDQTQNQNSAESKNKAVKIAKPQLTEAAKGQIDHSSDHLGNIAKKEDLPNLIIEPKNDALIDDKKSGERRNEDQGLSVNQDHQQPAAGNDESVVYSENVKQTNEQNVQSGGPNQFDEINQPAESKAVPPNNDNQQTSKMLQSDQLTKTTVPVIKTTSGSNNGDEQLKIAPKVDETPKVSDTASTNKENNVQLEKGVDQNRTTKISQQGQEQNNIKKGATGQNENEATAEQMPPPADTNEHKEEPAKKIQQDNERDDVPPKDEAGIDSLQDFNEQNGMDSQEEDGDMVLGNDGENEDNVPFDQEPKSVITKSKSPEKSKPREIDEDGPSFAANYQNQNIDDSESYFFSYFMMVCIMFICGYVAYHNKQKILALVVEGRKGRRPSRTRRPNSANYRKLDSNLEEAVTSSCNKNATQVIY